MSPAHSRGKSGRLYRYQFSTSVQRGESRRCDLHPGDATAIKRLVADPLERLVPGKRWICELQSLPLRPNAIDMVLSANRRDGANASAVGVAAHHLANDKRSVCLVRAPRLAAGAWMPAVSKMMPVPARPGMRA